MVTDSQNPLEHTCVISYCLFITKHDTLKEKKKKKQPHFQKQKPGRGISLHHFYVQLGSTWVDAFVRAEPGNQENQVRVQICTLLPRYPSLISFHHPKTKR